MEKNLNNKDLIKISVDFNIELALIKAVAEVESSGAGFLNDGTCKILFEPYIFSRQTEKKFDGKTTTINEIKYPLSLSGKWDAKQARYGLNSIQWDKLRAAMDLNREAALKSCSWGRFQIMGFNHKVCGYDTIEKFVIDMNESEYYHLLAFINFITSNRLDVPLKNKDFSAFAKGYNGISYSQNKYDIKLKEAYERHNC